MVVKKLVLHGRSLAPLVRYATPAVSVAAVLAAGHGANGAPRPEPTFRGSRGTHHPPRPDDPDFLLVGSGAPDRAYVWSSADAGATWTELPPRIPATCAGVNSGLLGERGFVHVSAVAWNAGFNSDGFKSFVTARSSTGRSRLCLSLDPQLFKGLGRNKKVEPR